MPKIVIMAGGTGGHVFPGLAVAHELKERGWQVEWFGTKDRMEATTVPEAGYPIHFLNITGVRGKGILRKLLSPFRLLQSVMSARKLLKQLQPDVVLGMGGYASGPGGIAAWILKIPLIIHEQNAVFGLTNRILSRFSDMIFTGFDVSDCEHDAKAPKQAKWIGNPVRKAFFDGRKEESVEKQTINILITGGSLGAQALNQMLPTTLNQLAEAYDISIIHQTGKGKLKDLDGRYGETLKVQVLEFLANPEQAMHWADIIICRAGALTVAEVAACGKPAIFVPLPIAVDDHQRHNANFLVKHDAAFLIDQNQLGEKMGEVLTNLCESAELRVALGENARKLAKPNAAADLADKCEWMMERKRQGNYE